MREICKTVWWKQTGHGNSLFLRWRFKYPVKLLSTGFKTGEKKFLSSLCACLGTFCHFWRPEVPTDQKGIWQIDGEGVHLCLVAWQWTQFLPKRALPLHFGSCNEKEKTTPRWFVCFYNSYLYVCYWPWSGRRYQPRDCCFERVGSLLCFHVLYFNNLQYKYIFYISYIIFAVIYCGDTKSVLDIPIYQNYTREVLLSHKWSWRMSRYGVTQATRHMCPPAGQRR